MARSPSIFRGARLGVLGCGLALLGCTSTPTSPEPVAGTGGEAQELQGDPSRALRPPSQVLLISVSGLAPKHYDPRLSRADAPPMPTLRELARSGVYADSVETVSPSTVYPVHATLVTGRRPDRHGVVADRMLGKRGVRGARYWHASRLRGSSLWQAAVDAELGVAALMWPSTLGAALDVLLPDVAPTRRGETWPDVLQGATTPWVFERVSGAVPRPAPPSWPSARELDRLVVDLACEIAGSEAPPALWLIRLSQTGDALLRHGPGTEAASAAFARADAEIARLTGCLEQAGLLASSALVVTGDRAVLPVHTRIDPNFALARAGLIEPDPASETGVRMWSAIVRSSGGSALVYAEGEDDAIAARRALRVAARDTRAFRVVPATELRELRADPLAWFGLEAEPGYTFGDGALPPLTRASAPRGAGGYPPARGESSVGLVAWGRGLRQGVRVPLLHQVDVAPTVASLLGVSLSGAEGQPLVGVLALEPANRSLPAARGIQ